MVKKRPKKVNLANIRKKIAVHWSPINIARINESVIRVVKIKGEYHWHEHRNEDEFFLMVEGEAVIQTENGDVQLSEGEGVLIPRGMRHCSRSDKGAILLVFEPWRTKKEGDPVKSP